MLTAKGANQEGGGANSAEYSLLTEGFSVPNPDWEVEQLEAGRMHLHGGERRARGRPLLLAAVGAHSALVERIESDGLCGHG